MNLTGIHFVFPVHLRESVLINSIGGIALSLQLLASSSPHASHKTVRNWLAQFSTTTSMSFSGDIVAVFDNNQVMSRRWRVKLENKVFCNVITVVAMFSVNDSGSIQCRQDL